MAQNKLKQAKPKRLPTKGSFKAGQSGNPGGRPKDGESFASVLRDLLAKDGPEVAEMCKTYAKDFKVLPSKVNLRTVIALRWISSVLGEPSPGLMQQLVDRTDGPVPTKVQGDADAPFSIRVEYVRRSNTTNGTTSSTAADSQ